MNFSDTHIDIRNRELTMISHGHRKHARMALLVDRYLGRYAVSKNIVSSPEQLDHKSLVKRITRTRIVLLGTVTSFARVVLSSPRAGANAIVVWIHDRGRGRLGSVILCALVDVAGRRESVGAGRFRCQRGDVGGGFSPSTRNPASADALRSRTRRGVAQSLKEAAVP